MRRALASASEVRLSDDDWLNKDGSASHAGLTGAGPPAPASRIVAAGPLAAREQAELGAPGLGEPMECGRSEPGSAGAGGKGGAGAGGEGGVAADSLRRPPREKNNIVAK